MLPFSTLLRISRPRFWHYVLGPMLICFVAMGFLDHIHTGYISGGTDWIVSLMMVCIAVGYFTLPANLWIYGWNDIADADTDKYNNKKGTYENKLEDTAIYISKLKKSIWIWNMGYIVLGCFLYTLLMGIADCFPWSINAYMCDNMIGFRLLSFISLVGGYVIVLISCILLPFLITSYMYSCPPMRAKAKPFLDGIMNVLYIATPWCLGLFSEPDFNPILPPEQITILVTQHYVSLTYLFFSSLARCMAMHCYSAIPDISADAQAGLRTTAVYLGKSKALIYCGILYLITTVLSYPTLGWFSVIAGCIYIGMMVISYRYDDIFWLYKKFPLINLIVGFALFWYIVLAL